MTTASISSAQRRRVLIVSPSFPPTNAPDMQRVRMSLPYYRENGWDPVVLAIDAEVHGGPQEMALSATVPPDVPIIRCGALPRRLSRWLRIGNLGLRAWLPLLLRGGRAIRREKIDLVFLSNSQFLTFTLGRLWRFWHGVPYVIDLQDPWRTDQHERPGAGKPPGGWKYQLARLQAWLLEGWSFRRMAAMMSVSQNYLDDLGARYRWFAAIPTEVIRFGASDADLLAARNLPSVAAAPTSEPPKVRFVYTGVAIVPHALEVLFGGLRQFREAFPQEAARLQFEFVGTSYAAPEHALESILPIAQRFGVADLVREAPRRLGHLESLQMQAGADVLLLIGSRDPAYSPSKLYPYYLSGRPILAVVFEHSYLASLLADLACAEVVCFREEGPFEAAFARLRSFFQAALEKFPPGTLPPRNDALFRKEYLAATLTARQCALFDRAVTPLAK